MICPFCQFKRTNKDTNPDWQCPSCNKAYNKYSVKKKNKLKRNAKPDKSSVINLIDILFFLMGISLFYFGCENMSSDNIKLWNVICLIFGILLVLPMLNKLSSPETSDLFDWDFLGSDSDGGDGGGDGGGGE